VPGGSGGGGAGSVQRPPPSLLRGARRRRRVAGTRATNGRKRGVGGFGPGVPVGSFYRATGGREPSDRGSAAADDSRDAYAGRAQGVRLSVLSGFLLRKKRGEKSLP
jgi:hypothetical protein